MLKWINFLTMAGFVVLGITVMTSFANDNWIRDLTEQEFMELQTYQMIDDDMIRDPVTTSGREFPEIFDWREMNGVTSVKNQGNCGSCWAFAALAVLESQLLIHTGVEYNLSEQHLVDCDPFSWGCGGGNMESAWMYMEWEPARLESDYPYEASDEECRAELHPGYVRTIGYDAYAGSVDAIKEALMDYGPLATSMGANSQFQNYSGGCYADDANTPTNHGVVIVGWDDTVCEGGSWIVKNSWGTQWGENGYFYIRRGDLRLGNYFSMVYFEMLPAVTFEVKEFVTEIDYPQADQMVHASCIVENTGFETAENTVASISTDSASIVFVSDTITLPDMSFGESFSLIDAFSFEISPDAEPGELVQFTVTVQSDNGISSETFYMLIGPVYPVYHNDFEGDSDEGWTTWANRRDHWTRGKHADDSSPFFDPTLPYSGSHLWGQRLITTGKYPGNHSTYLLSPRFDVSDYDQLYLRFKRWLTVEKGIYDQATILVNDKTAWENPQNNHLLDSAWQDIYLNLSEFIGEDGHLQIAFTLDTDAALEFGGWNIDDLEILTPIDQAFQQNLAERLDTYLGMPILTLDAGDQFLLYSELRNYGHEKNIAEYIALEVMGEFWFWPEWTQTISSRVRSVPEESFHVETILTFEWPVVDDSFDGVRFWSAVLEQETGGVFDFTFIEWGWY
jgi:C1A family cysteine protease